MLQSQAQQCVACVDGVAPPPPRGGALLRGGDLQQLPLPLPLLGTALRPVPGVPAGASAGWVPGCRVGHGNGVMPAWRAASATAAALGAAPACSPPLPAGFCLVSPTAQHTASSRPSPRLEHLLQLAQANRPLVHALLPALGARHRRRHVAAGAGAGRLAGWSPKETTARKKQQVALSGTATAQQHGIRLKVRLALLI